MAPARVGVIGAGVSGPVMAMFLKQKGYDPVLYERLDTPSDAGLGIGIQNNGQAVLARIPGLLEHIGGYEADEFHFYSVLPEDTALLGVSDHPRRLREATGHGTMGVRRPLLHQRLVAHAQELGVPVLFGHKLEALQQDAEGVTVLFKNGIKETFSFVIGCDGLHSGTRGCLFGETPADYTGVSQWGGLSPTPEFWKGKRAPADIFGNGSHMILVPMNDDEMVWAISQSEPEAKEDWKSIDEETAEHFKKTSKFSEWPFGIGELVKSSVKIIRYGIYDRPELETWFKGRVVLIGDAAHPTSPHLGQGANQAYEDAATLIDLLEKHNPSAEPPSLATLSAAFTELVGIRLPRTAALVKQARAQGELRVTSGVEACIRRNNVYREMCADPANLKARFGV